MKPTRPNKTKKATASDIVMTPISVAKMVVDHYKPSGFTLEPARGSGNIYRFLPSKKDWCEISEGKDFFAYTKKVDWIITNPPYSIYNEFLKHCFEIADNVVFLCPLAKAFKSMSVERIVDEYGGLREIWPMGGGGKMGFAFGFPVGCLYYQKGYKGPITRYKTNNHDTFLAERKEVC